MNFADPLGLLRRELTDPERDIVSRTINQIDCYGLTNEAGHLRYPANTGQISVDTELDAAGASGETSKFTGNIYLSDSLLSADFDLLIVPTLGHEYAHRVAESLYIFPLAITVIHGLGYLVDLYNYKAYPDQAFHMPLTR